MLRVLDLFSGIGGFSLGLERTGGFQTVAFCEIDPFCRSVLRRHWPTTPIYEDVRELIADTLQRDGVAVDVIAGGFPCQDISGAGKQAGLEGERSGLWFEFARLIGELRPRVVFVENVTNLLSGPTERPGEWFARVLGSLAALGYDATWDCIPAVAAGAPHIRDRIWLVAHPGGARLQGLHEARGREHLQPTASPVWRHWETEPDVARVANGIPRRLVIDDIRAFGNAVVPQVPEIIGRAVLRSLERGA